jgi:hypothetical protein
MQTIDLLQPTRVTFRLGELIIDCTDPAVLANFWAAVLGYEMSDSNADICAIEDPEGIRPAICFQKVSDEKHEKNRLHFDLDIGEGELEQAIEELTALGATRVDIGQPLECSWAVLADPEGNEFCVIA